ncbi:MAG TPA: hypothetical protein VFQ85_08450 [Mycobacteriales bacterium]|jgi:hypothetical protein|nr:hypothetical protein [Mycobacteriales bacterium]
MPTPSRRARLALLGALLAAPAALPAFTASVPVASAAPAPLSFGPAQPADPQRDQGEPNIEIDPDGRIYTCGPTGFTTGADYAQVSTDGGDQFHLLGTPPRGQLADRGGGDCYLSTGKKKLDGPGGPETGTYALSYVGLADTDFTTAHSEDNGATFGATPTTCSGATDRQWTTFIDATTSFVTYNDIGRGELVVQKSTNGGLTYDAYGPCSETAQRDIGPQNGFPGPMNADTNGAHNTAHPGTPLVYFGFSEDANVKLALSTDAGDTWTTCLVAESDLDPTNGFVVADEDSDGNVYVGWGEKGGQPGSFHAQLAWLPVAKLASCTDTDTNPGFSAPVTVERAPTRTLVFPWLVASGAPGRVAMTWYGSTTRGVADSPDFKGPWDVYVAQTLDARAASPVWTQVKATTHPMHYDQVCLSGLLCAAGGDRSLADFFAMALDPAGRRLVIVYDESGKVPDGASGPVAIPNVLVQNTGPSNLGGEDVTLRKEVVRTFSDDPDGDAQSPYSASSLTLPEPPPKPAQANQPALDVLRVDVGPQVDLETGAPVADGGITVTMKVADLSGAELQKALTGTDASSLIWAFRWINGYQPAALSVHWDPVRGFAGGFDDFATGSVTCFGTSADPKCLQYPGATKVPLEVNQDAGIIRLSAPRSVLKALTGALDEHGRPVAGPASRPGVSRLYSGTVFTMGSVSVPELGTFLYPVDETAAFDFVLPGPPAAPGGGDTGGHTGGTEGTGGPGGSGGSGSGSGGSGIPATGGPGWPLGVALVAAGSAAVAARLRRRTA